MWESNVRKVVPYVPGEQPKIEGIIKLNTNENPYPPAPAVAERLPKIDAGLYRKYPDPTCSVLTDSLAEFYNVSPKQVFVGVGSDDVLAMAFLTFFNSDKPILFADVTYSFYDVWANVFKIPYETVPLKSDFSINPKDYMIPNGGVVIANPNAPTGLYLDTQGIEEIIKANLGNVVIVDEAYIDFGGESVLPLVDKYENLLVVRTFSKSRSMAGMRIGFAIGSEKLIKYLSDVKYSINSYTLNMASLELGALAVADRQYFETTCKKVIETRERSKTELKKLGFSFPDSYTNFIFAKYDGDMDRDTIASELRKRKIVVRCFNGDRVNDYMRISIGTDEEMDALFNALKEILHA